MTRIRPFRPGDEPALADICLKTADAGADATGILDDDDLWAEIFVLPYVARHPDLAFVVETDDGRVAGYIVGAPDTDAFEEWFRDEWWPRFARALAAARRSSASRQDGILIYAYGRRAGARAVRATSTPRTCTSTCCPRLQGQGWGRRLIETLDRRAAGARA